MNTYSLDLNFMPAANHFLPHPPRAEVYVKAFSQRTEDGPRLLTPDCLCMQEMDYEINRLQKELEEIRKMAKEKFRVE